MPQLDVILRGGTVVTASEVKQADIGIEGGRIVALEPSVAESAREVIDATGLHIFPGLIDSHVHFNEPGRAHWEGIETGSRALAAGGGTMFFDMPLNSSPPVLDGESFDCKAAEAAAKSLTDFALWGGLVPGNLDKLEELHTRGVIGFKAFMSASGIDEFPNVDDTSLREGMKRAAKLGQLVAVHAESDAMTKQLAQERIAAGKTTIRDYLDSRPIAAELDAIRRALDLAGETGCALHVVHVSCGEGVALIAEARRKGVNATCETCPHYLVLTEDDVMRLGAVAKCAPPLRTRAAQDGLWQRVQAGDVLTIGSDHSPAPPDMKTDANFFKVWGGISGAQHTLPLLLTAGHVGRGAALTAIAQMTSLNVAARFRLPPNKGAVRVGADADLALVDLASEFVVQADELFYRHRQSPYVGRRLRGRVVRTLLRGQTIYADGRVAARPAGRLVKPVEKGT